MIKSTDLAIKLSGGLFNNDPNLSLGGTASATTAIGGKLNNLFDSTADRNKKKDEIEYRCIYIKNISVVDSLYHTKVWLDSQPADGCDIKIGTLIRNEVQRLNIYNVNEITGGSFKIKLDQQTTSAIDWDNAENMRAAIETALKSLSTVEDASVTVTTQSSVRQFSIEFVGASGNRFFPLMTVEDNAVLRNNRLADIQISASQHGSPINDIAADVAFENNKPSGVNFQVVTVDNPISLGTLPPKQQFYLWVQRSVSKRASTSQLEDSFVLHVTGRSDFSS